LPAQQDRFDAFRAIYNNQRPHEALGQRTPASRYQPLPRPYPDRIEEPHYGQDVAVRRGRSTGQIKWAGELIFIGEALIGEPVGILETERGDWRVRYADVDLGYIHPQRRRLSPRPLRGVSKPGARDAVAHKERIHEIKSCSTLVARRGTWLLECCSDSLAGGRKRFGGVGRGHEECVGDLAGVLKSVKRRESDFGQVRDRGRKTAIVDLYDEG
jgi:hypothetical protein